MGFKLPGKSIQSGTSAHSSALKMVAEQRAASALKAVEPTEEEIKADEELEEMSDEETAEIDELERKRDKEQKQKDKDNPPANINDETETKTKTKKKKAYGGTKTWAEGQKDSGGTLNEITRGQKTYEKKMKEKDPSWNKREDNKWKKTQNKINAAVGSKKVYDVTKDVATKEVDRSGDGKKDTEVMRGIGSNKGKTLTTKEKSLEKANISTQKDIVKKSKGDKKSATTKEGKDKAKNTIDKAQKEIGEIRSGRDNEKTGTVISRFLGKRKAKRNERQLKRRKKKNKE